MAGRLPGRREARKAPERSAAEKRRAQEELLRARGFRSVDEYRDWCRENGFSTRLDKTPAELEAERQALADREAERRLSSARRAARNPTDTIRRICDGEDLRAHLAPPMDLVHRRWTHARREIRPAMRGLLLHVSRYGALMSAEPAVRAFGFGVENSWAAGVCALAAHAGSWVRGYEEWRPRSHNLRRQFGELARHLLARYPVPAWMDSAFFEGAEPEAVRHQCWFAHVGSGKNLRTADLPIALTSKMAHQAMSAPAELTVPEALRHGQVRGLGGDVRLVRAVLGTRLREHFENDEFWTSVIVFLVANPMMDPAWIGPLVDYLQWLKFAEHAEEPGFTMKGRTVAALLRRVERWHEQVARIKRAKRSQWKPSGFPELAFEEGDFRKENYVRWTFKELLTSAELLDEGQAMHHCVATYSHSCAEGRVSIWSLLKQDKTGHWRWLTLEVENRTRQIVQARGIYNKMPDDPSMRILKAWADRASLTLSSYL